jgi:pimeloyl-ACP methyl ester carboxylesterase
MTAEPRSSTPASLAPEYASLAFVHASLGPEYTNLASEHATPTGAAADLAARQAELVAALVASGPLPSGFDPDRLAVARRALLRKRAGEAAAVWPLLAASLGQAWPDAFAASVAGRASLGALRDGWDLARELSRRGELGDTAAVELAEREVSLRHHDGRPRRLPAIRRRPDGAVVQIGGRVHHLARR